MPEDTVASVGCNKRFECRVIGYPTPRITWLKDDVNISRSDRYKFDYSVDGYVTMEIENVTYADVGSYQCLAVNSEGWASTTAHLKVKGKDIDNVDDTMTVHRMTFDKSGSRRDSLQRPLVITDSTQNNDNILSLDTFDRTLLPDGLQQISLQDVQDGHVPFQKDVKWLSNKEALKNKNEKLPNDNKGQIKDDLKNNLLNNDLVVDTTEIYKCRNGGLGKFSVTSRDETDDDDSGFSGNLSSCSSVNQKPATREDGNENILISVIDEEPTVEKHNRSNEILNDAMDYLKADDLGNRGRRLTGDSGIEDDDYSSFSSEEDMENTVENRRKSTTHKMKNDVNMSRDQEKSKDEDSKNVQPTRNKKHEEDVETFDDTTTALRSSEYIHNSLPESVETELEIDLVSPIGSENNIDITEAIPSLLTKNLNAIIADEKITQEMNSNIQDTELASDEHDCEQVKDLCVSDTMNSPLNAEITEQQPELTRQIVSRSNDTFDNSNNNNENLVSAMNVRKDHPVVKIDDHDVYDDEVQSIATTNNCHKMNELCDNGNFPTNDFETSNEDNSIDMKDKCKTDDENSNMKRDAICRNTDEKVEKKIDGLEKKDKIKNENENTDVDDIGKSKNNDQKTPQNEGAVNKRDSAEHGKGNPRDVDKDTIDVDKGDATDVDKEDPTAVDKGDSTDYGIRNHTHVDKTDPTDVDKGDSTEVDKGDPTDVDKGDATDVDKGDPTDLDKRDPTEDPSAVDKGDSTDDGMFHSDDEEQQILAEIRPNIHLKKLIQDETRSNTISFQSAESWSIYNSCDDFTLSESNFDTLSYQNIDEDEFILMRRDSKSGKGSRCSTDREKSRDQDEKCQSSQNKLKGGNLLMTNSQNIVDNANAQNNNNNNDQNVDDVDDINNSHDVGITDAQNRDDVRNDVDIINTQNGDVTTNEQNSCINNNQNNGGFNNTQKVVDKTISENDGEINPSDAIGSTMKENVKKGNNIDADRLEIDSSKTDSSHEQTDKQELTDGNAIQILKERNALDEHKPSKIESKHLILNEGLPKTPKSDTKNGKGLSKGELNISSDEELNEPCKGDSVLRSADKDHYESSARDSLNLSTDEERQGSSVRDSLHYSTDEYYDDESDISAEEIEEERCDILRKLDLSSYVINESERLRQLSLNGGSDNSQPDDVIKNGIKAEKEENLYSKSGKCKLQQEQGLPENDTITSSNHSLQSKPFENTLKEEFGIVDNLADTRPALPNTLFLDDKNSSASVMDRILAKSNVLVQSPPETELGEFDDFINLLTVVPGKDNRHLLSPIVEEGMLSQTFESMESEDVSSPEDVVVKKSKRPSVIDLTVTDTDGIVEKIDLEKIDDFQSFCKPLDVIDDGQSEIPRIIKGPTNVTAMDGGEIVIKWTILGTPDPEVVIFKDGDELHLCDGITLEKDENVWVLNIPDVIKEDAGLYEICAVNSSGNDILKTRVDVKTVSRSSSKIDQETGVEKSEQSSDVPDFVAVPENQKVVEGEPVLVKCEISDVPDPQVLWLKDREEIVPDERVDLLRNDIHCQLSLRYTIQEDEGTYLCRVSNSVGVNQVQFTLDVCENEIQESQNKNKDHLKGNFCLEKDRNERPIAPMVQLDMSESDELFSRKYEVLTDYSDEFNNIDIVKGEIIEVLDRSKQSHWLVKSLSDHTKVCYVPPYILQNIDEDLEFIADLKPVKSKITSEEIQDKTKKVLTDLIESETDYICDLKDLLDTYKAPVKEEKLPKTVADKESGILNVLSNLYQFHRETLLPNLLKSTDDIGMVGDIFSKKRDSFSEYVPFCTEHDKAMESTDIDQMQALMEAMNLLMGDSDNAFEDMMNRPLERIHEYIDILKTLIKLTAQAGGDCSGLMAAVQMLSEICRNMEDIVLLDRIQGYHGDVKDLGPILKHENVINVKANEDKDDKFEGQRHVILFPDKIMITKPTTSDPKGKLEFEKIIDLKDVSVGKHVETDGTFTVELWDTSLELSAPPSLKLQVQDFHAKQAWVRDIGEAKKKLELKNTLTETMPEFKQKLKGKKLTSTPKKHRVTKDVDAASVDSDRSSDDFNILGTRKDLLGDRYVAAEFEDGTTRPLFRRKLQKTIIAENSTARLECEVAGIPQPKILWLKNNRPLFESDHCKVVSDGAVHALEFIDSRREDTGLYTARAMNVNGSTISTAELYVGDVQPSVLNKYKEGLSDSKYQTPAYFFQMNSCQVEEGRLARFDCRVVAYPKPDIVWMKDGKVVEPNDRYKLLNFNNEIYSLLIQNVVEGDMGRYTCWAHNKYGEAMTEAYLNVIALQDHQEEGDIAPKFLTRFYDQTLTEGVPAELQCLIDGRPMPTIKWLFNDIELIPSDNIAMLQDKNLCSLCIKEVTAKDLGTYTCNLKNPLGEASCSAGLNVLSEKIKNVPVLPKFLKRISDQNMRTGEGVTFEVVVIGEPPPNVTWLFNHKPISDTRRRFKISQDGDVYRLTIDDLILDDDGKITCKAVNSEGEVYSSGNLLVRESRRPSEQPDEPKFVQKDFDTKYGYLPTFLKKIEDTYIPAGKDGKFECRIMGIPEPSVTWLKDGRPISNDGKHWISQDGGNCYLTIRGAADRDQGVYTCSISNASGENSCTAYMRLSEAKKPGERYERESSLTPGRRGSLGKGEIPTMPYDKPTISDIRPESTRMTWQPVLTSALSSDSKNIKYIIEGRELPGGDWRKMASGIHGNTHLLRNLRGEREYDFRVRAENQFGLSDATQPVMLERPKPEIDEFAESMKSKVPQFKRPPELPRSKPLIADMGTDSVKLAWQPAIMPTTVPSVAKKPPHVTYRLEAQELPASDWLPLSSCLSDTSHYLSDLLPDRDYNVRVRAENKYGLSEPTEPIWIPRAKAFPGVPIARPEIVEMEPHSVKLRWERVDVPTFSADDDSLRYMIEMQVPPARDWTSVARDIPGTVYVVSDLEPGQDYKFRVRARTPLGILSEPSPVTSVYRTIATTVAPIDRLELEYDDVDFDGIRLRWDRVEIPPYSAGEEPLLYMIEVNEPPLDEWKPVVSGLPTPRYRVTDLIPERDYNFRVRALSSYGVSPPSYTLPVSYRRPLPGPSRVLPEYPQIVYDETDALQLAWQPPKVSTPLREPIKYRVELQAPPSLAWKPLATGIPDTRYPIRGLGPSRDYMFRVVPETSAGLLEPLPPVSLTSLPAPRTFLPSRPEILDYEPDSFMLSWRRPSIDTHLPMRYRVEVQEPPLLDWHPLVSDVTDTRYRVTGLRPSKDYSFRIVPYTGTDYWEPLPPVTITSLPVRPRFRPHEPTITPLGTDSVKLSWQPADIPMYPRRPVPITYIADMRTLPSYDWTPVGRNIMDTSYIVKGLSPHKEYQFRIRPQTDYGTGEPTLPVTYYRKPVPYVRHEPIVSNIYGDSVLLSWQPAEFKGDFKYPSTVTYSIEMQDRPGVGPWMPLISGILGTNYHVTGLHPDKEYFFRVRGHSGEVIGEPSAPVYLTHRAGPPRMLQEQPYISELSPSSVHLQWRAVQLPSRITDYAPVTYRLEIQELPNSDWMVLADGIPHTDFHVTNLHPDKEYNFRVRAVNKYGCSEPTSLVQIRRRAVPPKMPKDEPLIYDIGHGSLMLSWRPAEVPHYIGDSPVTYTIYVQEPPSTTWRPLYRRIPYTSYHVTNLQPDRDYCFRVQAENMYGLSQPTNTVRLTRLSDFRAPIDIPEITEFDETRSSLQLRWKPKKGIAFGAGPLKYQIESWEPLKRTWISIATDIPDTNYRLTGLSPDNDYILRVRAQAESALSDPSYPISTSRYRVNVPITRPQIYDVEPDSVRLSWQPYPGRTAPRRYKLELRESTAKDWRPVTTDIYGTTHKVTGLKSQQDYEFRLRGITEKGQTDYIYSVPLHRRSVVPKLPLAGVDVVNVEDDYVDLRWRMVDIPAFSADDKPLAFLIEAQQLPRYDWLPVASGISDTGYRVKGLQRNQDYVFRIRGEYPSGLSQPSQHVSVYRRPIRPGVPITRPEIFDEEPTSAHLRWQRVYTPPYRYNEPLSYRIESQEAPYRTWRPVAQGLTMTEHTLTDLMPKKDYLFRIRAETPNGDISAPTPPISYYKSHLPSPRAPRKTVDYKILEQDFSMPSRSYVDHLTTFIPPRLPLDKPDMTEEGPSTVFLRWRPALVPDRARDKYPVTYSIEVKNPPELDWREIETGLTGLSFKLDCIHPELDYMFRIRAHNEFGTSEATLPVSLYRPIEIEEYFDSEYDDEYEIPLVTLGDCEAPIEEVPPKLPMETPKLTNVTGEKAMLHWLPARIPAYAKKVPITYIVEIKEDNMPGFSRFQSGLTDTKFYIEGLSPTQGYQFRVKAETQFGCSDPTLAVVLDRKKESEEVPLELEDVKSLINTLQDKVKRPSLDMKRDDLDIPQAKIRDIIPTGVPPRMSSSRPLITNRYGGNLTLSWGPGRVPSYVKGSVMNYIVERRDLPHSNWTMVADNLMENEYDVTGLSLDRDYMFRIRAKNQFGTSDPTMPCSVINVKDDYVPPVFSRSQSRDGGTPRMLSRRSSIESPLSLSRQISLDESEDGYRTAMPPEFKSKIEETQYGVLGRTAKISLAVRAFPLPVIEWDYKGDNLTNKKKYKSFITPSGVISLEIFDFCLADVGEYRCKAENDHGIKSIVIQLINADAPTFIEPCRDLYLDSRRSGKFECKVDGVPYPKIKWMKDWRPVTESSRLKIRHTEPNQWSLHLGDVISLDSGMYTCVAENAAGKSICSANLFVDELETSVKPIYFREAVFEDYFYVLEEIGTGRHSIVRKVIEKATGKEYAAKIIPACNEDLKYFFGHELNNLKGLSSPRVPSVVDAFQSERQLVIVMELIKGRSLVDHILNQDSLSEYDVVCYIKQLLETLRNLHASNIVHLDIKPSNIHMASPDSNQIKLIDFGFSRHLSLDYDVKMNYGTEEFTSPEQIENAPLSTAADMWSVGILTYILLSGVSPLRGEDDSETLTKVLEGKINLSKDNFKLVSEDAKDFLAELLVVDPIERLTAGECLKHPWIKETEMGKGQLDLGHLKSFQAREEAKRKSTCIRGFPRLQNLTSVLQKTVPVTPFQTSKDEPTGDPVFPEAEYFGEYLDEESWYDWQNRYHKGPGAKIVPLSETDYLGRVRGLRPTRRVSRIDDDDDEDDIVSGKQFSVLEDDDVIHEDPCLQKELDYVVVADDVKQRKQSSKDLFPKDENRDENPQILSKFYDMAFNPEDDIILTLKLEVTEAPAVTWYRNEELISEGTRIGIKITESGTSLKVVAAKPYDAGIYKCVVRSKGGKVTAAARILVGDVPSQPSRPVATKVSSNQVLLLWEPPTTNGNAQILGYRVDYRKSCETSWSTGTHPIDECTIISDLVPDTFYRCRVCAVNQFGSSAYSIASTEILTLPSGQDKIYLDEYTSAILARQNGSLKLLPTVPSSGDVQLTEGSFSEQFKLTETLYSGKFSEFKIAESISTGRSYAAKITSCAKGNNSVQNEFEILRLMNHDKIIRVYEGFLFSEKLYVIVEYLYGVNVLQHFAFKTKYSEDMVAIVIRQVFEGVQFLQHVGVVHLNLQPSSVVMRSRRHLDLKITGFSHARKISGRGEVVPCAGYTDFIAPEVITREITTFAADIWTVGVLSFLLLSGESPFRASTTEEIYSNIAYCRYDAHLLYENITRDALRFINRILRRMPRNRMSIEDCLEDKWLQVADTTVKSRQEAIFTTAKLRSFADLYRERGILGTFAPADVPEVDEYLTAEEADEDTEEKKVELPPMEKSEKEASEPESKPKESQVLSSQEIVEKVAETVVTGAMEQALDSAELQ